MSAWGGSPESTGRVVVSVGLAGDHGCLTRQKNEGGV